MSRVKDGPTIHIRRETHKELGRVKNEQELRSFDETIQYLLRRPEFTKDELNIIYKILILDHKLCELSEEEKSLLYMNIDDKLNEALKNDL